MRNDDGTTPLASPECTPSVSTSTRERAGSQAAQRRRHPQLLVVAAARIEPDHQLDFADPPRERLQVRGQIVAAAFLAAFDQTARSARAGCSAACSPSIAVSEANTA